MALTQDRIIALVKIIDIMLTQIDAQRERIGAEVKAAVSSFYEAPAQQNGLTSDLLARLQAVEAHISVPFLDQDALITFATEREHFRTHAKRNTRVARAMKRARERKAGTSS